MPKTKVVEDSLDLIVKDSFDTQDDEDFLDSQGEGYFIVSKKSSRLHTFRDCQHYVDTQYCEDSISSKVIQDSIDLEMVEDSMNTKEEDLLILSLSKKKLVFDVDLNLPQSFKQTS